MAGKNGQEGNVLECGIILISFRLWGITVSILKVLISHAKCFTVDYFICFLSSQPPYESDSILPMSIYTGLRQVKSHG